MVAGDGPDLTVTEEVPGAVRRDRQLTRWARVLAFTAAGVAAAAAPVATCLLLFAIWVRVLGGSTPPGWVQAGVGAGTPAVLAADLACGGWAVLRHLRRNADGELLLVATVLLTVAFAACAVTGAVGSS